MSPTSICDSEVLLEVVKKFFTISLTRLVVKPETMFTVFLLHDLFAVPLSLLLFPHRSGRLEVFGCGNPRYGVQRGDWTDSSFSVNDRHDLG